MFLVGLTGGIASGKSTVSQQFFALGAVIIDADIIAQKLLLLPDVQAEIITEFGNKVINPQNHKLDKYKLRNLVFLYLPYLRRLENILHHKIKQEIFKQINKNQQAKYIVVVVPLLFECGWNQFMDYTVAVTTDSKIQIERLQIRKIDKIIIKNILAYQLPQNLLCKYADNIINNNKTMGVLESKVKNLHSHISTLL